MTNMLTVAGGRDSDRRGWSTTQSACRPTVTGCCGDPPSGCRASSVRLGARSLHPSLLRFWFRSLIPSLCYASEYLSQANSNSS